MRRRSDFIAGTFIGAMLTSFAFCLLPTILAYLLIGILFAKCCLMFFLVRREERKEEGKL
jgi:uncharacterized membrane protein YccC